MKAAERWEGEAGGGSGEDEELPAYEEGQGLRAKEGREVQESASLYAGVGALVTRDTYH